MWFVVCGIFEHISKIISVFPRFGWLSSSFFGITECFGCHVIGLKPIWIFLISVEIPTVPVWLIVSVYIYDSNILRNNTVSYPMMLMGRLQIPIHRAVTTENRQQVPTYLHAFVNPLES